MKIFCDIDKSLPKVVRQTAESRVLAKFDRFSEIINEVQLSLRDLNGPRGGVDTECVITVRMRDIPEVIIHERNESIGKAMYNGLERAARNISRSLQKRTEQRNKRTPKPVDPAFT